MKPKASPVEQFIEAVNESPKLMKDCAKALDGSKDARKFVALGAKHGYKFTQTDARSYFGAVGQSRSALTKLQLKPVIGAKVDSELPINRERLKGALSMLRSMRFKKPPTWTVFSFAPSAKK